MHISALKTLPSSNVEVLQLIKNDIAKYKNEGKIILMGDLNGHTDNEFDHNPFDNYDNEAEAVPPSFAGMITPPTRMNQDTRKVNKREKDILDMCIDCDMVILNGRKLGDLSGKFTCYEVNGHIPSVIDYVLVDADIFEDVTYSQVKDLSVFSDHCPIELSLGAHYTYDTKSDNTTELQLLPHHRRY